MTHEFWKDDLELTISSYPESPDAGADACERLLSTPGLPDNVEQAVRRNATWYLPRLADKYRTYDISIPVDDGWSCFNPSIATGPDGELRAIIRTANYVMSPEGRYGGAYDADQVIRTRNYWVQFADAPEGDDWDFGFFPIQDDHLRPDPSLFPVEGFEDARLFWISGWKFIATARDRNERGICQQVMCYLEGDRAKNLEVLSPAHDHHQKNWMPIPHLHREERDLFFVDSCYPTIVRDDSGDYGWVARAPYVARHFRGGSQIIDLGWANGGLAIIHESVDFSGIPHRAYQHRFVLFGSPPSGPLEKVSLPFCFERRGVEFAAGMAIRGDDLLISYGVHDAKAMILTMPLADALAMLRDPLPEVQ